MMLSPVFLDTSTSNTLSLRIVISDLIILHTSTQNFVCHLFNVPLPSQQNPPSQCITEHDCDDLPKHH